MLSKIGTANQNRATDKKPLNKLYIESIKISTGLAPASANNILHAKVLSERIIATAKYFTLLRCLLNIKAEMIERQSPTKNGINKSNVTLSTDIDCAKNIDIMTTNAYIKPERLLITKPFVNAINAYGTR